MRDRVDRSANQSSAADEVVQLRGGEQPAELAESLMFWEGASGRQYVHSVYDLRKCPELPPVSYVFVHRSHEGICRAIKAGQADSPAHTQNRRLILAAGRHLGANEVHIHYLGGTRSERAIIAFDIESAIKTNTSGNRTGAH